MKSKNCIKTTKLPYFMAVLLSVFMMQFGFAQESKTVSGTITSAEDGFGVPGATVQVQGTKSSTVTDFDGKYKVEAKTGDVLVITFVGFKAQNIIFCKFSVFGDTSYLMALEIVRRAILPY